MYDYSMGVNKISGFRLYPLSIINLSDAGILLSRISISVLCDPYDSLFVLPYMIMKVLVCL